MELFPESTQAGMASRTMRPNQIRYRQKATASVLTEEMLARFASRAPSYDRDNRFMQEDFEELRASKYLLGPLPREFGGAGLTLAEMCREQTAVGISRARNCAGREYARLLDWGRGRSLAAWRHLSGMVAAGSGSG